MSKINFIFDKTLASLRFKKKILKKYKNYPIKNAEYVVVAGGDGFMLQTIKKNYLFKKPFYGINCGSYGFLMNKNDKKNILHKLKKSKKIIINPIKIKAVNLNQEKEIFRVTRDNIFNMLKKFSIENIF